MKIIKIQKFSINDLIEKLKTVSMLKDTTTYPYEKAFISVENIHTQALCPAQNYVLTEELKKVRSLKWALKEHGVDLFQLNGYIKCWFKDMDEPIDALPPIVEESIEADGAVANIVNDGMHRVYLARMEWVIPQVVFIRGVPKHLPYYAFPLPGGWDKVQMVEELPEGFIKKWHRIENYKTLYRNFNSAFENVGGPRGTFTKQSPS